MDLIISLVSFIVTIGILVTIHEFGHFIVAKKLKIKVLRFSVGFGKVIKAWQIGDTSYTLCALPFGGFVKMLDENESRVDESEKHLAFNNQNVFKRIAVVIAGPLANFLLAIIIFTFIFISGTTGLRPIVGVVTPEGIADISGINTGDQFISINKSKTPTISEFSLQFLQALSNKKLELEVKSAENKVNHLNINVNDKFLNNTDNSIENYLGIKFSMPRLEPIIDKVLKDSPASIAGIKRFDRVVKANNKETIFWSDFVDEIKNSQNKKLNVEIIRYGELLTFSLTPNYEDGVPKIGIGVHFPDNFFKNHYVKVKKNYIEAFLLANKKTYQLIGLNLLMLKKMIIGEASTSQLSGPIGIADYAGKTAQTGVLPFLYFLALISIGLGLINLLPIPALDGGHLFFFFIEIIKGSEVNKKTKQILYKFGYIVILSLISLALYNDLNRLLF
jgi:regulator of sigma E protease